MYHYACSVLQHLPEAIIFQLLLFFFQTMSKKHLDVKILIISVILLLWAEETLWEEKKVHWEIKEAKSTG